MVHIDLTLLITIFFGFVAFLGYLAHVLVKGVSCLTALKKDVEFIKENQSEIKTDVENIQKYVFSS